MFATLPRPLSSLATACTARPLRFVARLAVIVIAVACGDVTGPAPEELSLTATTITGPAEAIAAGGSATVTVQLRNSVGEAVGMRGVEVRIAASAGSTGAVVDAGNGRYTAEVTSTRAGVVSVTATVNSQPVPGAVGVVFRAGAPASVVALAGDLQTGTVGTAVAAAPSVRVSDGFGNVAGNVAVTFAIASGGGVVTGSPAMTNAEGVATAGSWVLGSSAGAQQLSATVAGLPSVGFTTTAVAGAAAQLAKRAGDLQTGVAGTALPVAPAVLVSDAFGNPRAGVTVMFAVASGGASIAGAAATTGPDGVATLGGWTLGTAAGSNTLTASVGAVPSVTFSATGRAGGAASVTKLAGDAQTGTAGSALSLPARVRVADANDNAVEGVVVTFAPSAGASVAIASATTDAEGIASSGRWTVAAQAGQGSLVATTGALSTTFVVTTTAGSASAMTPVAGDGQGAIAGTGVGIAPSVRVTDAHGNAVQGAAVSFGVTSGAGSVTGAESTTDASGTASVGGWILGRTAGPNVLTATLGGVATVRFTATGTPGAAATMSKAAGDAQTGVVGTALTLAPSVTVTDANGNAVAGAVVTFAVASGAGSVQGASTTTNAGGAATVGGWTLGTTSGANTLVATSGALSATFNATATSGAAASIARRTGDGQTATVATATAVAPGVVVTDANGNPVIGTTVVFSIVSGGGSLTGASTITDAAGVATVGSWTLGQRVGANSISASAGTLVTTFAASATSGVASSVVVAAGDGQAGVVGTSLAVAPAVTVTDAFGNPVAGISVAFAVTAGSGSVVATTAVTSGNGVATSGGWTLGTTAGANGLTATVSGLTPVSFSATGTAGAAASITKLAGDAQSAVAGATVAVAPSVSIRDASGNPVSGATVVFAAASGGGSVTGASTMTNANGVASVGGWTLGTAAGANSLTATSGSLVATFTATGSAGGAASIVRTAGEGQTATVGTTVAVPPSVTITDANGNAVGGVGVTFAVSAGGGAVSNAAIVTDAAGVATVGGWTLGTGVGVNTLAATAGSLVTTFTATGTVGAAANLVKSQGDAQAATVGTAVAIAPAVRITDQQGNPVAGASVTFAASGTGVTGGSPAVTDANGVATVGSWTLGTTAGAQTLAATAGSLTASFSATATAGTASGMVKRAGDGQTRTVNATVGTAPSVTITDASGNPVANVAVTFGVASGGGSVTGASATTDASGVATVGSWTLGTMAGANTLSATAGSLSATFTATGAPGPVANITKTAGDGQSTSAGTSVAAAPAVRVTDAQGNPVAGAAVTFAIASGGGSVSGGSTTTDASGIAAAGGWTLGTTAGANSLTATAASLVTTFTASGTVGAPASLTKSAGDGQTATAGSAVTTAPRVLLADANGNPVAGATLSYIGSGSGGISGTTTTDASGFASIAWTLSTTAGANTLRVDYGGASPSLSTTFTATGTAGAATALAIAAGDGQTAAAGAAVATVPLARATDTNGNPVAGVTVTFAVAGGGGSVGSASATTDGSGIASAGSWALGTTAGANSLTASSTGLASVTYNATAVAGPAASLTLVAGDGQSATVSTAVAVSPQVRVTDSYGNAIVGRTVSFAVASGGGSVSGASAATNGSGIATLASWTLGGTVGANTVTASSAGLTGVTFTATATAQVPALIEIVQGNTQTSTVGSAVPTAPRVRVKDGNGAVIAGATVTFAVAGGGGSATGTSVTTDASGLATVGSWVLGGGGAGCGASSLTSCSRNALTASATTGSASPVSFTAYVPPMMATAPAYQAVGNATLTVPSSNGLLAQAYSINGGGTNGQGLSLTVGGGTASAGTTVSHAIDGSFTVLARATGNPTYAYTIGDGLATATITATINVPSIVWYVQGGATATPDGSDAAPYPGLATLQAALGTRTNDVILVKSAGNTRALGGALKAGQVLYGQFAATPYTFATGSSATYRNGGQTLTLLTGGNLTFINGLTLATNNTITGLLVEPASGTAIAGSNFGTLTLNRVIMVGTSATALDLTNGVLAGSAVQTSSSGGTYGVSLNGVSTAGVVDLGTGNLAGNTLAAMRIVGPGAHDLTYSGGLQQPSGGRIVDIQGHSGGTLTLSGNLFCSVGCLGLRVLNSTGGTINFSGTNKTLYGSSSDPAVNLTSNTGATINFLNGGLVASGLNSGFGMYVGGGGTVSVTGAGNKLSGNGRAGLEVNSTTIGSAGLNFESITSSFASFGISLVNTGTAGSLIVTGNGGTCTDASTCTGGSLRDGTGYAMYLSQTLAPSFDRMIITNSYQTGIRAETVNNLRFTNGIISNSGVSSTGTVTGTAGASNLEIINPTGDYEITGNTLTNGLYSAVSIASSSTVLGSLMISGNTITSGATTVVSRASALSVAMSGTASAAGNLISGWIINNRITGFPSAGSHGISLTASNTAGGPVASIGIPAGGVPVLGINGPMLVTVNSNLVAGASSTSRMGASAIYAEATGRGQGNVEITSNGTDAAPLQYVAANGIQVRAAGATARMQALIDGNRVGSAGSFGIDGTATSLASGIENPVLQMTATNNVVANSTRSGISVQSGNTAAVVRARLQGNNVSAPTGTTAPYGIFVSSGDLNPSMCVDLLGNTTAGGTDLGGIALPGIGLRKIGTSPTSNAFGLAGLTPSPAGTPAVEGYVGSRNTSAAGVVGASGVHLTSAANGFTTCSTGL